MDEIIPTPKADRLIQTLGHELKYDSAERSFSPWHSYVGLGFEGDGGISKLHLHYNRRTITIGGPFFGLPEKPEKTKCDPVSVRQTFPDGQSTAFAFTGMNTWVARLEGFDAVETPFGDGPYHALRAKMAARDTILLDAYLATEDERDPDAHVPMAIGIRVVVGAMGYDVKRHRLKLRADDGKIVVAFHVQLLDVDHQQVKAFLSHAPARIDQAVERTKQWLDRGLGEVKLQGKSPDSDFVAARAALTLLFNGSVSPGMLGGRVCSFPSRGRYPTHFLWDTCFHNLALERMEERLAEDAILLLTENLRIDGKMAHFICSTWVRPDDSQPPLVGWSALRLLKARNKHDFGKHVLPSLVRNNRWWLTQRMTSHGLITCHSPYETGWDDTPRFDAGPVVAVDMNSYLILQLRATAEIAQLCGETPMAEQNDNIADRLCGKMLELCYDDIDNVFYDVQVTNGEKIKVKTPACFLPLLTDVGLKAEKTQEMLEQYLLDDELFFGPVPFPTVAYNEPSYSPSHRWRGPTWLPIAWLMIEVLEQHGFDEEAAVAAQRLYDLLVKDGDLREYYNSSTGEGLGAHEQGWTAAIFLRLREMVQAKEDEMPAILDGSDTF